MYAEEFVELARYRMEQARECLSDAQATLRDGRLSTAANRSYYAVFNAMRAMLNLDGKDFKRHSGIIAGFRERYIKTGIFPPRFSDIIGSAFDIRNNSDYQSFYIVSREDVAQQTENAAVFVAAVERRLNELIHGAE